MKENVQDAHTTFNKITWQNLIAYISRIVRAAVPARLSLAKASPFKYEEEIVKVNCILNRADIISDVILL